MSTVYNLAGARMLTDDADAAIGEIRSVFQAQREDSRAAPFPSYAERRDTLEALLLLVLRGRSEICDALNQDFGGRSKHETLVAEVLGSANSIRYALKNLHRWMRPQRRSTSHWFLPGSNRVVYQPLGVVGVVAPWNYSVHLALAPVVAAIAAGNRVMVKMSEYTPTTTALMKRLLSETFPRERLFIAGGGPTVAKAFASLPFDHLLFTGSTAVGREVMKAASDNLTPVTLELGGKCPAVVDQDFPISLAAERIVWGKMFNAGQTCIAPDYVLVPAERIEEFADLALEIAKRRYPGIEENSDYTAINNARHYRRLLGMLADASQKGARVISMRGPGVPQETASRKLPLTVVLGGTDEMLVMREEIFGPVLPIIGYRSWEEAMAYANERDRPLAMYLFSHDSDRVDYGLKNVTCGGVTLNDTLLHYLQDDVPFGGVGPSGLGGHYHGREGFETFSNKKAVFTQRGFGNFTGAKLLYPPYGRLTDLMIRLMMRF